MCGIAGAFFVRDRSLVERFASGASEVLRHRGPDDFDRLDLDEGSLVHRRLSILDPTPAGRQPFSMAGGRQWLIHNGEIYNYLELREELKGHGHQFRTDTDTEVIVAAYREWGPDAVARFNGIWAFALWDGDAGRLLLSRDRLGVKPLYLIDLDGGIFFASEIKALLGVSPTRDPNPGAIRDYLWHGLVDHADETFFDRVKPLPPATNLVVSATQRSSRRYWAIADLSNDADPRPHPGDRTALDQFGALLTDAIRLQLRSDVALGTCLSGGIDSSTIVARAGRLVQATAGEHRAVPQVAVTASFPGSPDDETEAATRMAEMVGVRHILVTPGAGELVPTLSMLLSEHDEPFISSSILAQRAVMEGAHLAGVKVMLDGQGADETLAGYPHYRYPWLLGLALRRPIDLVRALRACTRLGISPGVAIRQSVLAYLQSGPTGVAPIGRASRAPAWLGPALVDVPPLELRDSHDLAPHGTPLARHLRRAVLSTSLPALLRYEDRSSMRFAIEARVPYLDHRLVEQAMLLPDRLKISSGVTKVALRTLGEGLIPESTRTSNRKIGFSTPQDSWLAANATPVQAVMERSLAAEAGYVRHGTWQALAGGTRGDELWRVLSVELWLRAFA